MMLCTSLMVVHSCNGCHGPTKQHANLASLYVQHVHRHYRHAVTKDETHQRRAMSKNIGAEVDFKPEMQLTMKKKAFLANPKNKQKFLYFIGSELQKAGVEMYHSAAPSQSRTSCYQTASKILNIRILQDHLDPKLTASLLFLHAITGCDTTSRPYSIGKVMAMNKCHQLMDSASLFMKPNQSHDDVNKHGHSRSPVQL